MLYGKFNLKITCGSRVMSIYSLNENGQTHIVITVYTKGSCNLILAQYLMNIMMELDQNVHTVLI